MAIKKQFLKSKPVCKVTFTVPAAAAKKVMVVGDFNEWDAKKSPLKKLKNGSFKGTLDIESKKSYEFKYLIDGVYANEVEADGLIWNAYAGAENSQLKL